MAEVGTVVMRLDDRSDGPAITVPIDIYESARDLVEHLSNPTRDRMKFLIAHQLLKEREREDAGHADQVDHERQRAANLEAKHEEIGKLVDKIRPRLGVIVAVAVLQENAPDLLNGDGLATVANFAKAAAQEIQKIDALLDRIQF